MPEKGLKVEVLSPDRSVWSGDASSVRAPGVRGSFGVLPRHVGLVSALGTGALFVGTSSGRESFSVSGGFLEVKKENGGTLVKVLSDSAESVKEVDVERAKASRERAAERLKARSKDVDVPRAQAALARAINRLRVSGIQ